MKKQVNGTNKLFILFFLGILFGCIGINILVHGNKNILEQYNIYPEYFWDKKEIDFFYIAGRRITQLAVVLILYFTISKKIIVRMITFLFASVLGMYLSVMMMRLGMYGGIYTLMLCFPHFIFYATVMNLLYLNAESEKVKKKRMVWVFVLLFWLCGIILEQVFFPIWLQYFMKK